MCFAIITMRCVYDEQWPPQNFLRYSTNTANTEVWARPNAKDFGVEWEMSQVTPGPDQPWSFSQPGTDWRLCNVGNQLRMQTVEPTSYSAMWWIQKQEDAQQSVFWGLRSGAQNNLYIGLPQQVWIPVPQNYPCILTDIPTRSDGQDCQWWPEVIRGPLGDNAQASALFKHASP